jgi:hypothetical protein
MRALRAWPLLLGLVFLLSNRATAQDRTLDDEPIMVPAVAWWVPGEVREIEVLKGKRQFMNDSLLTEELTRIVYQIEILEETEEEYRVRWNALEYEGPELEEDLSAINELMEQIEEEGIIVVTNEVGEFLRIDNVAGIQEMLSFVVDMTIREMNEATEGMADLQLIQDMRESMTSVEFIEQVVFQEIAYFYGLHGYEYPVGQDLEYADLLPNFTGGNPVLARGLARVIDVDEEQGTFVMLNELTADEHEMAQMMRDMFRRAGTEAIYDSVATEMTMSLIDTQTTTIDYFSGWTLEVDRIRIVSVPLSGVRTEEFLYIQLLD